MEEMTMDKLLTPGLALTIALAMAPTIVSTQALADEKVGTYRCNGIPLGPCALPPSMTRGVMRYCTNHDLGNGTVYQDCHLIRVIRD
jgi:hypothetical protein